MQIVLKGIKLIDPVCNLESDSDLMITDGIISKIGNITESELKSSEVFDFTGCICTPGFFDMHTHLREPGREDEETIQSGCRAAAEGGFTGIACMPDTNPVADSAEVIKLMLEKSAGLIVDLFPIAAATIGSKGESLSPMIELSDSGAVGFSDDTHTIKNSDILKRALEYASMTNKVVIDHCEDESFTGWAMNESFISTELGLPPQPSPAEEIIAARDIAVAEYSGGRLHLAHISSKRTVELIRDAKMRGVKVTAETLPHLFAFDDSVMMSYDTDFKVNPPIRSNEDAEALISGLSDGTIDCIASDHQPHSIEEKDVEFIYAPFGSIGLETALPAAITLLVHKNKLALAQLIEKMSINPRKILGLEVPSITIGEKANITIIDLNEEWTYCTSGTKSKSKNAIFKNYNFKGRAKAVINNSKIYSNGNVKSI